MDSVNRPHLLMPMSPTCADAKVEHVTVKHAATFITILASIKYSYFLPKKVI